MTWELDPLQALKVNVSEDHEKFRPHADRQLLGNVSVLVTMCGSKEKLCFKSFDWSSTRGQLGGTRGVSPGLIRGRPGWRE